MTSRHARAQAFLATLSENCPELPFEPTLLPELFAATAENSGKPLSCISELVEKSQRLAAKILRVANSAYYGMPTAVSSLPHAMHLLGLNEVRNIILQIGVTSAIQGMRFPMGFQFEELWEHQLRTAVFAKEITFSLSDLFPRGTASPDDIYAAGLLHDLGKTMLASICPDDWLAIWDLACCDNIPFHKAEDDYWGMDHSVAGSRLLAFWGLPPNLTELVNWHHAPKFAPEKYRPAVRILAAANTLANMHEELFAAPEECGPGKTMPESVHSYIPECVDTASLMEKLANRCTQTRIRAMVKALSE